MGKLRLTAVLLIGATFMTAAGAESQPGSLVLTGSTHAVPPEAARAFMRFAGGRQANIVVIEGKNYNNQQENAGHISLGLPLYEDCTSSKSGATVSPTCAAALKRMKPFGVTRLTLLVADGPQAGSSEATLGALRKATGVWFTGDAPGDFLDTFCNNPAHEELRAVLERVGVVGGDSGATAALSAPVTCKENLHSSDEKAGGLGILTNVVIDRGPQKARPSAGLTSTITAHPAMIGMTLGEHNGIIIHNESLQAIGTNAVLVSDGELHNKHSYYRLTPGSYIDLETRNEQYIALTSHQKFDTTLGVLFRPWTVVRLGAAAGIAQSRNAPSQWGQGGEAYAHRLGVVSGLLATRQSLLFSTAMIDHEDLRRMRSSKIGFWPRAGDSIKFAFESRRDSGSVGFAYARFIGDFGTGALARQLYPSQASGSSSVNNQSGTRSSWAQFGLVTVAADVVGNVFFEFSPDINSKLHLGGITRVLRVRGGGMR